MFMNKSTDICHAREGGHPGIWIPACAGMTNGYYALFYLFMACSSLYAVEPGKFYTDGLKTKKTIALTFDDGPGTFTPMVLDILDQYKIKATFFMNGDQVQIRPQIAKEVIRRGHEVGDHTWSHMNFYAYES